MALTVTLDNDGGPASVGSVNVVRGTLAFDSSYPTSGETLNGYDIGLGQITRLVVDPHEGCTFAVETSLPAVSPTIMAYVPGITTEGAGALTLDDYALSGIASTTTTSIGLEASLTNPTTTRFGLMKEVASTEDLSSLAAVPFTAYGY